MTNRTCNLCGFAGKTTWKRGLCNPCYCRAYEKGNPEDIANASNGTVAIVGARAENSARWTGNDALYGAVHKRLKTTALVVRRLLPR